MRIRLIRNHGEALVDGFGIKDITNILGLNFLYVFKIFYTLFPQKAIITWSDRLALAPNVIKVNLEVCDSILQNQQEIDQMKKEDTRIKSAISRSKQFNEKVDLNLKLKEAEKVLNKSSS